MKKLFLAVFAAVLFLSGCSAADNSTSRLLDPMTFGSVLSKTAPSALLPKEESAKEKNKPEVAATTSATIFTTGVVSELRHDRYYNEEFSFAVAAQWRDNFEVEISDPSSGALNVRAFTFYFVDREAGLRLPVLRIDSAEQSIAELYGQSKTELGRTSDGRFAYFLAPVSPEIPADFALRDVYIAVYRDALAEEKFDFQILV